MTTTMGVAKQIVRRILPYRLRTALRRLPRALWLIGRTYQCNCCGWHFRRLAPLKNRANAQCPWCGSAERHRLLALYLRLRTSIFDRPTDVLHVAPEEGIRSLLRRSATVRAVGVDLAHPLADRKMDIRALDFPDGAFDVAICSHVLEHVEEDRKAMTELHRVLRPGGTLLVMVPFDASAARTREDPNVVDPAERKRLYGQSNHVRLYGRDLVDRLAGVGFEVTIDRFSTSLPIELVRTHALASSPIFRCRKVATSAGPS